MHWSECLCRFLQQSFITGSRLSIYIYFFIGDRIKFRIYIECFTDCTFRVVDLHTKVIFRVHAEQHSDSIKTRICFQSKGSNSSSKT